MRNLCFRDPRKLIANQSPRLRWQAVRQRLSDWLAKSADCWRNDFAPFLQLLLAA